MSEIFLCSSKPPYTNEKYLDQPKQRSAQGSSNRTIYGQQIPSHKCREKRKEKSCREENNDIRSRKLSCTTFSKKNRSTTDGAMVVRVWNLYKHCLCMPLFIIYLWRQRTRRNINPLYLKIPRGDFRYAVMYFNK